MDKTIIVDSHAHACGEYLSENSIRYKLQDSGCSKLILTPGQSGSRITYPIKNKTHKDPYADLVSGNNKVNRKFMKFLGTIKNVPKGNEHVYELTKRMPQIVYQSYWITKTNIERLDDDHKRMNFVSVKLHQCWEDFHIDDEYFKRAALWASRNQIPLFIHIYSREEMLKLIEYIRSNPESIIVIGHLYCLEDFLDLPKEMLSNVFFDLSNYYFVSKERFLMGYQAFGAEHFLLGSDTPYGKNALEKTVGMVRDSGIAESDINKICGKNAVDLFHL